MTTFCVQIYFVIAIANCILNDDYLLLFDQPLALNCDFITNSNILHDLQPQTSQIWDSVIQRIREKAIVHEHDPEQQEKKDGWVFQSFCVLSRL